MSAARRPGRPTGELALALLDAASQPGTIRDLAARAQVGRAAADYTASRLIARGALVLLTPAGKRPVLVQRAGPGVERKRASAGSTAAEQRAAAEREMLRCMQQLGSGLPVDPLESPPPESVDTALFR